MPSHAQNSHYYLDEDPCYELFEIRVKEVSAGVLEVPPSVTKSRVVVFSDLMHESTHALACHISLFLGYT